MSKKPNILGVTIMEVMVVIVIIAIATAMIVPLYINHVGNARLKLAAETFYNDLTRARSEALKTGANVTVSLSTGSSWCYGLTTAASCDCSLANSCNLGQVASADYSGTVKTLTATGITTQIVFEPKRGTVTPTGTVIFTSGTDSEAKTITVNLNSMGSAQVCSSSFGEYKEC